MRTLILTGIALLLVVYSRGQVDSLRQAYQMGGSDSIKMEILNELIAYTAYNDTEAAIGYALDFDSIANQLGNEERMAHSRKLLGICYYVAGQYDQSVQQYLAALEMFKQLKDTFDIGMIFNNIGSVYDVQNNPDQSLNYFRQAKGWFDQTDDLEWQALIRQNLATQYDKMEQKDTALLMYEEALALYESPAAKASAYRPLYYSRLAMVLINLTRLYSEVGLPEAAIRSGERALGMTDVDLDPYTLMQVKNALGIAYAARKEWDKAQLNFEESLTLSRSLGNRIMISNNLLYLSKYQAEQGNHEKAYQLQAEYVGLIDSLYNERREEMMNELITRYETEQKEQEIVLLQSSNEIKDLRIAKARRGQWMLVGGLVVLALVAGIVTWFLRVNQRKNQELAEKNQIIQAALTEKEALLREIHHRVKNNLQVISSLLSLQERRLKGEEGTAALQESRNRVQAMALIHQNLYQQEEVGKIDLPDYMQKLSNQIAGSFENDQQRVALQLDVAPIHLDVDSVIPLALITNELLTNAYKYAFKESGHGTIFLGFKKLNEGHFELRISDNGVGIPIELADGKGNTFGMKLIRTFAKKLKSELHIDQRSGTSVSMSIPIEQLNQVA